MSTGLNLVERHNYSGEITIMSGEPLKFLVLNPSPASLPKAIKIGNSLNKKNGPFSSVLLLGDIVSDKDCNIPEFETPLVPVYHTEGVTNFTPTSESGELIFTGTLGITKTTSGVTIGYLTGRLDDVSSDDIKRVFADKIVDILITYQWPSAIAREEKLTLVANSTVDEAVQYTKPKYHFSVGTESGRFFERAPFAWKDENRVTRFISLAQQGSSERWFYAFSLSLSPQNISSISNITTNPFETQTVKEDVRIPSLPSIPQKRSLNDSSESSSVQKKVKAVTPQSCFFCLSNPKVAIHLLVSIGDYCYVTATKGPLTMRSQNLEFSGHGLITPIEHIANLRAFKEDGTNTDDKPVDVTSTKLFKEIQKYQESLIKMFQEKSDSFDVVFWEISREKSIHHHLQFLPIQKSLSSKIGEQIEKQVEFNNKKYEKSPKLEYIKLDSENEDHQKLLKEVMNSEDYMLITVAHSIQSRTYYLFKLGTDGHQMDLQFPRRVLSFLLKMPKRLRWENCIQSFADESKEAEALKENLEKYHSTGEN